MAHIRKLHTAKRRNGRPVAAYEVRWTEGRPKRYRQETLPTRSAAEARAQEIEAERAGTGVVTGRDARLAPFAVYASSWLLSLDVRVARGRLKARTRAEYARILETYLLPEFGTTPIGSLSPARAEAFAASLLAPPPPASTRRKALSAATFQRVWHVFGRVCGYAVPTSPLDRTEIDAGRDRHQFTPHPLTPNQVAAVAAHIAARYPVYGLVVEFMTYSGLRAGELAGLEVGDVRGNAVRVERTKRRAGGEWIVGTPKSRKSRRTVPLDGWLADALRAYLEEHPRRDDPTAPLFPNRRKGGAPGPRALDWDAPVEPGALYANVFQPACAAVGLAPTRLHDLRHTFAVLSLSAGEHYMQVSQWLGHANYTITLNVYGGYIPAQEGGKAAPLARPTAPAAGNVLPLRPRATG